MRGLRQVISQHASLPGAAAREGNASRNSPWSDVPIVNLSSLDAEARDARLAEIISRDAQTPFDLAQGPWSARSW